MVVWSTTASQTGANHQKLLASESDFTRRGCHSSCAIGCEEVSAVVYLSCGSLTRMMQRIEKRAKERAPEAVNSKQLLYTSFENQLRNSTYTQPTCVNDQNLI
mmetsp:Transcript_12246/g.28572  ORF Transcript_12246/g.28572 Transcript_12246/m.28572 type:complete len:103 (-) Transcript_12246:26-334(-)